MAAEAALDEEDNEFGGVAWRLAAHANMLEATMELPPRPSRSLAPAAVVESNNSGRAVDRMIAIARRLHGR